MNKTAIILLMCLLVFSSCTVIPDKQIDETVPDTVDYTVDGTEKPFTDAPETDETLPCETEESVESETNVPKTDIPETEATETAASETNAPETDAPETDKPETDAPETTPVDDTPAEYIISEDGSIIYTPKYYSGSYRVYDSVDYDDEEMGDYYREMYPSKAYNENVNIELEFTVELDKTVYKAGESFWIGFKAVNVGEPFMYIEYYGGYFDSWVKHSENSGIIFYSDYYIYGRPLPDIEGFEVLFETGEKRVDAIPYTVTEDTPLGKYDLYVYFGGYVLLVNDAFEIVE